MSTVISREIINERRPWKTPIAGGTNGGMLDNGQLPRPGHTYLPANRRPWKSVIKLGDGDDDDGMCTTRYYNSSGVEVWHKNHRATIRSVAIDPSGNIYECGDPDANGIALRKRSPTGRMIWERSHGLGVSGFAGLRSCAVTPSGGVVVGGHFGDIGSTGIRSLRQYSADGILEWSASTAYPVMTLDVDEDGIVALNYVADETLPWTLNQAAVQFYDQSGGLLISANYSENYEDLIHSQNSYSKVATAVCFTRSDVSGWPFGTYVDRCTVAATRTTAPGWPASFGGIASWISGVFGDLNIYGGTGDSSIRFGAATCVRHRQVVSWGGSGPQDAMVMSTTPYGGYYYSFTYDPDNFYLPLLSGTYSVTIDAINNIYSTGQSAVRQVAQVGDKFADPPIPFWSTTADRNLPHNGTIYGSAINDSGALVIGGVVAPVSTI